MFLLLLFSTTVIGQGSLGVSFGLNDDNFGSITDLQNKIENYNLDIKNSTGFHFGVFSEIDLITFFIRPELNLIFSKSKNASAIQSNNLIQIADHSYKSTDIQMPIIFGYKVLGPVSVFWRTIF